MQACLQIHLLHSSSDFQELYILDQDKGLFIPNVISFRDKQY